MIQKAEVYADMLLPIMQTGDRLATMAKAKEIIFVLLETEAVELFTIRKGKTKAALGAILRELDLKYRKIVRLTDKALRDAHYGEPFLSNIALSPNGFITYVESDPELKRAINTQ